MNKCSICSNYDLCNQVGGETICLLMSNFKNEKVMKAIGIKIVDLVPMTVQEAIKNGYKPDYADLSNMGYEVTYPDGYKTWCPKSIVDKYYFKLCTENNGDKIYKEDVENFIKYEGNTKVGTKTTNVTITTITGYEVNGQASCVDASQFNIDFGAKVARPHAIDQLWSHLGFVLQWAKNGLNIKKEDNKIPPHVQRMIEEYRELNIKCVKLGAFIVGSKIFKELPEEEQNDMSEQYKIMKDYLKVLGNRICRVGADVSEIDIDEE